MNPNLSIEETLDWPEVWDIVKDSSVFVNICDDGWTAKPPLELREIVRGMVENPFNHVFLVMDKDERVGCFICYQKDAGVFEVHTCLTTKCRGADAVQAGKMAMQQILSFNDVDRLVSYCPSNLPQAYVYARLVGFHRGGIAVAKWVKNGIEYSIREVFATKQDLKGELPCPSL